MFMITLTILVVLLSLIYYYIKSAYFTLHGAIPGIPPQFFFGNLIQLGLLSRQPASIPDVVLRLKEKFGDVYQIWLGANRLIIISNLQDVQYIFSHRNIYDQGDLFTKNLKILNPKGILSLKGAEFKRHATFTGPLFRRGKILIHFNTIFDTTDKLLDRWRRHYTDQNEIHFNMIEQSQQLLLAIFGLIAFDYDLQTLDDQSNELTHAFYSVLNTMEILLKLPTFLGKIYMLLNWKSQRAKKIIEKYLNNMIEQELKATPEND